MWKDTAKEYFEQGNTKDEVYDLVRDMGAKRQEVRDFLDTLPQVENKTQKDITKKPTKEITLNKDGTQTSQT